MRWLAPILVALAGCGGAAPPAAVENTVAPERPGEPLHWEPDEREWIAALLRELGDVGVRDDHPRLIELVAQVTELLRLADHGELTKQQLLVGLHDAEQEMTDAVDSRVVEQIEDLREAMRRAKVGPPRSPFSE